MGDLPMFYLGNLSAGDFPLLKQECIVLFPVTAFILNYIVILPKKGE